MVRLDLALHFFLRHPPLVRENHVQLGIEAFLVQVDSHLGDQPVQHETAIDYQVLVWPGRHGRTRRCWLRYLMRSSRRSRTKQMDTASIRCGRLLRERPVSRVSSVTRPFPLSRHLCAKKNRLARETRSLKTSGEHIPPGEGFYVRAKRFVASELICVMTVLI